MPTLEKLQQYATTVRLELKEAKCEYIKGNLKYYVSVRCSEKWCTEVVTKNVSGKVNAKFIIIPDLQPYSNYTVIVSFGRDNGNIYQDGDITRVFKTKPTVPKKLEIQIYSKTSNTLSLRVLPQHPPTGELELYEVNYCYTDKGFFTSNYVCGEDKVKPVSCRIWKNYNCITFLQLIENTKYTLGVGAKNVGTDFNQMVYATGFTVQQAPEPPGNLTATWDEYYNLTLSWTHPWISNGPISRFQILILNKAPNGNDKQQHLKRYPVNAATYNLTYTYKVVVTLAKSSMYSVSVQAYNDNYGGATKKLNVYTPPHTPVIVEKPAIENITNTTISFNLPTIKDLAGTSYMYIIIFNNTLDKQQETKNYMVDLLWNKSKIPDQDSIWIAEEYDLKNFNVTSRSVTLGNGNKTFSKRLNTTVFNKQLDSGTDYVISVLLENEFMGLHRYNRYTVHAETCREKVPEIDRVTTDHGNPALYALLLLLLVPIILFIAVRKRQPKTYERTNSTENNEPVYEEVIYSP